MVINNNGVIKTPPCCWEEGRHHRRLHLSAQDRTNVSFPLNYKYETAFLNVWCLLPSPPLVSEFAPSPDWFIVLIMAAHVNSCSAHDIVRTQLLKEWKVCDAYKSWRHIYYLINKIRLCRLTRQICSFSLKKKRKKVWDGEESENEPVS